MKDHPTTPEIPNPMDDGTAVDRTGVFSRYQSEIYAYAADRPLSRNSRNDSMLTESDVDFFDRAQRDYDRHEDK